MLEGANREDDDQCDIPCPANDIERCGGETSPSRRGRLARRQNVAANILLTVYIAINDVITTDVNGNTVTIPGVTVTQSADVVTQPGTTFTQSGEVITLPGTTFTEAGATVTDVETVTTTFVSTVTDSYATVITTVTAVVVCYDGHCSLPTGKPSTSLVYIFQPYPGEDCHGQHVYLASPCSCAGGVEYTPYYCDAASCSGKTVYKPERTEYTEGSICYYPSECTHDQCETTGTIYKPYDETKYGNEGPGYNGHPEGPNGGYPSPGKGGESPNGGKPGSETHPAGPGGKPAPGGSSPGANGGKPGSEPYPEGPGGSKPAPGGSSPGANGGKPGANGEQPGSETGSKGTEGSGSKGSEGPGGEYPAPGGSSPGANGGNQGAEGGNSAPKPETGSSAETPEEHPGSGSDKPVVVSLADRQTVGSILAVLIPVVVAAFAG